MPQSGKMLIKINLSLNFGTVARHGSRKFSQDPIYRVLSDGAVFLNDYVEAINHNALFEVPERLGTL